MSTEESSKVNLMVLNTKTIQSTRYNIQNVKYKIQNTNSKIQNVH